MMSEKKSELCALKSRIKDLADEGRSHGRALSAVAGPEREALRSEKRSVGKVARAHLLAYALARGVPYEVVERRSDPTRFGRLVPDVADVVLMFFGGPEGKPADAEVLDWVRAGRAQEAAQ